MGPFQNISSQKVTSLHMLIRFLRRLKCIGKIHTTTLSADKNVPVSAMGFADRHKSDVKYSIRYDGYDPSRYEMDLEIELEKIFEHRMVTDPWTTHFKF